MIDGQKGKSPFFDRAAELKLIELASSLNADREKLDYSPENMRVEAIAERYKIYGQIGRTKDNFLDRAMPMQRYKGLVFVRKADEAAQPMALMDFKYRDGEVSAGNMELGGAIRIYERAYEMACHYLKKEGLQGSARLLEIPQMHGRAIWIHSNDAPDKDRLIALHSLEDLAPAKSAEMALLTPSDYWDKLKERADKHLKNMIHLS